MMFHRFTLLFVLVLAAGLVAWSACTREGGAGSGPAASGPKPVEFRLGLVPDRNLYDQHLAYRALADYLESHTRLPRGNSTLDHGPSLKITLVTSSNYAGVLKDFTDGDIDGAFLGSLITVLAVDRCNAQVFTKCQSATGVDTYAGVIFVPEKSPITTLADLHGKKLGAVRTTMAGSIFPLYALKNASLGDGKAPDILWSGTHDDVIDEVLAGRVDAGAVKDLRLAAYEAEHPDQKFRRIATGPRAPDNALVISRKYPPEIRDAIIATLLDMSPDRDAQPALAKLGLKGFARCEISEYAGLYDMIESLGDQWKAAGVDGAAPRRISEGSR
jgi:phosphate/phosphite/phosphonate ABC transporter binding protein